MRKIPVGKTIAYAYGFLVHRIATVVSLTLVPALLYAAADYVNHRFAAANAARFQEGDLQTIGLYLLLSGTSLLVVLFATSLAAVGITEEVLGIRGPSGIVSFRTGRAEWRMMLATVRYFLGAVVLLGFAVIVSAIALTVAGVSLNPDAPPPPPSIALAIAVILSAVVFVYVFASLLRMTFLLAPTVVAEAKGGIKRSHELTKGNVWRMLAVIAAVGAPIALLAFAGEIAILRAYVGPDLFKPENAESLADRIDDAIQSRLLPWEGFITILFILLWGLVYSASAFAYRALTGEAAMAPRAERGGISSGPGS